MKTSKQDIQDLLAQLAADIEDIKAMLNGKGDAAGAGVSGNGNAISNDVVVSNSSATANADRILAEVTRLLEPVAQTCGKLPDRIKSYYAQLLLRIPQDLREELTRDNDTRKRKGQPTVEDKIDNTLTMAVAVSGQLNQLEDALRPNTPKFSISAWLKSVLSGVRRFWTKRPARWYRNPYILFVVVIYFLYFGFSIYSFQRWHYYRAENTRLRIAADKYRVDSIILRELYPQTAITLSAYEHIIEKEGAEAAIKEFRKNTQKISE